ncbi:macro domain-containing protein [Pirellulaceae bacterium SH501]
MDKSLAIKQLRQQGLSQRAIAITLGVSRGAVIRHLADLASDDAKAPTGSESPNSTKAPTGSDTSPASSPTSRSKCEPFREVILEMLERGLDSQRIFQDLQSEHGYSGKYWSVHRFVRSLGKDQPLPFRRMEVEAGYELQVDFGAGKPCKDHTGAMRKTYIFRAVLKHGSIPLGGAVLTGAGRLPFKGIIHVAGISMWWRSSEFSIRESCRNAMRIAREQGFQSIAFPLIGAGTGGRSVDQVEKLMLDQLGIEEYSGRIVVARYKT